MSGPPRREPRSISCWAILTIVNTTSNSSDVVPPSLATPSAPAMEINATAIALVTRMDTHGVRWNARKPLPPFGPKGFLASEIPLARGVA